MSEFREKAEKFTKLRLEPIWGELTLEEKEKLIAEAEEIFMRLEKRRLLRECC